MKKLTSILSLLLAGITVFSVAGCGSNLTPEQQAQLEKQQKIKDSIGTLTPMVVNDFEIPKDFYTLLGGEQAGVYVGKEKAHSGKQSAKIWVHEEDHPWSGYSGFSMPINTGWRGDLSDISLVKAVSFWAYNDQNETRNAICTMNLPGGATVKFSEVLQPNAWTQVSYDLKREQIPNPRCESISFSCEGKLGYQSKFYIDDVTFYKSTQGVQKQPVVLDQDEILSFDKSSQLRNIACDGAGNAALVATVEQSSFTATGRGSSMLITAPGGTEHYSTSQHWPTVNLYNISYTPYSLYDISDELCFDYYVPTQGGFKELWFHIYANNIRIVNKPIALKRGQWATFSMSVKDICGSRDKESSFDAINRLAFCWGELNAPDQSFQVYIDNIRMKVNKG